MTAEPLLSVRDLRRVFRRGGRGFLAPVVETRAVDGVSFDIGRGETLGLVGESGCGKTTTGRMVVRLLDPTSGSICFDGTEISTLSGPALRALRRDLQIVFQDPMSSLNPRMTAGELIVEPLVVHGVGDREERARRLRRLLDLVGLLPHHAARFPHEFSGGQRQRIGIARALALSPRFLVLDEAVSALDVSIQAQILNLLQDLRNELSLTYLFISHDLGVIRFICDRVAVMYLGEIVEIASKSALFEAPRHPYTQALLASIPEVGVGSRRFRPLVGDVPSASNPPAGCRFNTRCPQATDLCRTARPPVVQVSPGHAAACHLLAPTPTSPGTSAQT
jgi:peptide/nickel transport system ATP-binding protein/oligopeptide transport system ATP-binding protein